MYNNIYQYRNGNRLVPFAGPFLLGALTGGVAVTAFNPYRPRPNQYPQPYPPYGGYYSGYGGFIPY